MKSSFTFKCLTLLILFLLSLQLSITPGTSVTNSNEQVSVNVWKLEDWNQASLLDWYSQGIYVNATKGTLVVYNITSSQNNMTNPNSGFFSIGNVSKRTTDNNDLANTFALSIYPWSPGFVMDPYNWSLSVIQAENAAKGEYLQGNLSISNISHYNDSGYLRNAIEFTYSQNMSLGNQNTTLVYDFATGVLLYAKSSLFIGSLYKIELQLQSSTLITTNNVESNSSSASINSNSKTTTTNPGFLSISLILVLIGISIFKKKRNY